MRQMTVISQCLAYTKNEIHSLTELITTVLKLDVGSYERCLLQESSLFVIIVCLAISPHPALR
jgi:hypothetical protein